MSDPGKQAYAPVYGRYVPGRPGASELVYLPSVPTFLRFGFDEAAVFIGDLALDVIGTDLEDKTGVLDVLTGPDTNEKRALTFYNGMGVFAQSECPNCVKM